MSKIKSKLKNLKRKYLIEHSELQIELHKEKYRANLAESEVSELKAELKKLRQKFDELCPDVPVQLDLEDQENSTQIKNNNIINYESVSNTENSTNESN